ncbi:uncharacterized protein LOC123668050 [Melitaea cinxia]|uniref:uncharacterized protein LOC123668050 n=1 Tax=Melitaea cinxia TaxID=113334 RepID=UPI001E271FAE|nr:uncharacterized protein LOC123668050 [Melitaea cinxia]
MEGEGLSSFYTLLNNIKSKSVVNTHTQPFNIEPTGSTTISKLEMSDLQLTDSGQYMCSSPPFSSKLYILVQTRGPKYCARGAFWCGARCVLPAYVCDGWNDCAGAEDEAPPFCPPRPCARSDKLNCSSGRCISEAQCCRPGAALCREPGCCSEHRYSTLAGYVEVEFPPLFEDRHAPDDYGFIQSTIYTVTACALIFMIAVVLLVSALCKMHMKRAALRGYATAHRDTAHHYAARYPPRYEAAATRLLDPGVSSPVRNAQMASKKKKNMNTFEFQGTCSPTTQSPLEASEVCNGGLGLARLSAIFCSRYRQVPTQCCDVEMTDVRPSSLTSSPRNQPLDYRSPTASDLYFTDAEFSALNLNDNPQRSSDLSEIQRPLTLQLGRFHLSIPRFGRNRPRPDTPDVDIGDLGLVRLADETYTLNGRTIRLLGADFENYPALDGRPPPYTEAIRYKYGPPPEYLSREAIDAPETSQAVQTPHTAQNENDARANIELPPCYDDLTGACAPLITEPCDTNNNGEDSNNNGDDSNDNNLFVDAVTSVSVVPETISSVIDNLPAIDSDVNANEMYNA